LDYDNFYETKELLGNYSVELSTTLMTRNRLG